MFDLERLTMAINSGTIGMPPGLTHEERQAYIHAKLKELGIELQPLGRKYDPEATMRVIKEHISNFKPMEDIEEGLRKQAEEYILNA